MIRRLATRSYTSAVTAARPQVRRAQVPSINGMKIRSFADKAEPAPEEPASTEAKEAKEQEEAAEELSDAAAEWKAKFEAKDKEAAALKDGYQRTVADFRNLQETTKREIQNAKDYALQKFARDLLDSVDNFDRALSVVPEDKRTDHENHKELASLYDGIKMTQDVFEKTLAKHGLVKVNPEGEKFDPNVHEATFEIPQPDKEPGTIFHVQQTGFSLNNRVLRAAKVGVVKGEE